MSHVVLEDPGQTTMWKCLLGKVKFWALSSTELLKCMCSWWLQVDQNSMDGGEDGVLSCSVWWECSEVPVNPRPQQPLCLQSLLQAWTGLIGGQVGFCWHSQTDVRQHTQALQSPRHKGEDHPRGVYSWFLTFQGQRALSAPPQHATELWSTCWCSWKGTRMRKRRSVCLTLSQWFQTPPSITVCPEQPPSACHSTTELWALQVGC